MIVLNGNAANLTAPSTATVTALAASPTTPLVRVTTSLPHLFGTNDLVVMAASPAIGPFQITVIDATHFDLQGSTYSTTGTGTVTDESLTPAVQIPTDGDPASLQLSGMLSALQAILDRTQFNRQQTLILGQQTFIASGSFVVPPGAFWMLAAMCGGGGGGEGGIAGSGAPQGGGGAGAPLLVAPFLTIPGGTLTLTVGAGGAGGAAGGGAGGDGVATTINSGFDYPMIALGGAGCGSGIPNDNTTAGLLVAVTTSTPAYTDNIVVVAPGAVGVAGGAARNFPFSLGPVNASAGEPVFTGGLLYFPGGGPLNWRLPQQGGACIGASLGIAAGSVISQPGEACGQQTVAGSVYAGGPAGARGVTSSHSNGWSGGGGGGSAFGSGGAGGAGGLYATTGTGGNGGAGAVGGLGAGGGGGGCGGIVGSGSVGNGGAGGAGGAGKIILYWASNMNGI